MATTNAPAAGSLSRQRQLRKVGMGILYTLFSLVAFIFTLVKGMALSTRRWFAWEAGASHREGRCRA